MFSFTFVDIYCVAFLLLTFLWYMCVTEKNCYLHEAILYIFFKTYDNTDNDMFGNLYISSAVFINYIKELHMKFFENIIT